MYNQNFTPWVSSVISKPNFHPAPVAISSCPLFSPIRFRSALPWPPSPSTASVRPSVCSECTVYSISQSPRESGTQKTRQAETLSGPGGAGAGRQAALKEGGRGGSGTGSSRGGEGAVAAATVASTPVVTNTQRVSVCSDRRALAHARYLQVQLWAKKKSPHRGRGRERK